MKKTTILLLISLLSSLPLTGEARGQWWKGNLHTHTFWSDGDDFPEMVAEWYKNNGYHFLAFSDHNSLQIGEKWIPIDTNRVTTLAKYEKRFGQAWINKRTTEGTNFVRLRRFEEFHGLFQQRNKFLLMQGEEVSARRLTSPIHMGAINIKEEIVPRTGETVVETMQNNIDAVLEQRQRTGQPMFPHINHPNFVWAITAEELMQVRGEKFFEVANAHTHVHNEGDATHTGVERVWDIILTRRLAELNLEVIYGLGSDDSHNYHALNPSRSNPGRGWIVVRAPSLTAANLIAAMEAGDFYASSGVALKDLRVDAKSYMVKVEPKKGVSYRIQFIGTRKGFDPRSTPVKNDKGEEPRVSRRYSKDVGMVLQEVQGTSATYRYRGDEIYVRAKVISSEVDPYSDMAKKEGVSKADLDASSFGYQAAWTQPYVVSQGKPQREAGQ